MSRMQPAEDPAQSEVPELTEGIFAATVELCAASCGHARTTATPCVNDEIIVCGLERMATEDEDGLVARGPRGGVIDGRGAFQTDTENEFTAAIQRLTRRRVVAFVSTNQTTPSVTCQLLLLDATVLAGRA